MDAKTLEYMGKRVDLAREITKQISVLEHRLQALETCKVTAKGEYRLPNYNVMEWHSLEIDNAALRAFLTQQIAQQIADKQEQLAAL